jgi:Fe2+ or Zn2+ uptake regulation protein
MQFPVDQLRARGFRLTPQRLAILRILGQADKHLTPQEIYKLAVHEVPGMTEATVYRTLSFLAEQGLALDAHVGNGQLVYETALHAHHHLVCRACHATCVVDHADLIGLFEQLEHKTGFQIDSLHVTFFGLCPDCQDKRHADLADAQGDD